jgi:hypothetical protein
MIEVDEKPKRKRLKDMSPEERRTHRAAYMSAYRRKQAGEAAPDDSETREKFWAKNRKLLASSELATLQEKQERVLDQIHWMKYGDKVDPNDSDFVSLSEGVEDLVNFVRGNPGPHFHGIMKSEDIPFDWGSRKYWTSAELLSLLYAEGEATATYVRYGVFIGVPDNYVHKFLTERAGWTFHKVCELLRWRVNSNNHLTY